VTSQGIKRYENKTGLNELAVKKSRSKTVKNLKLYEPKRNKERTQTYKVVKRNKAANESTGRVF
jgi:hypothetical protein